MNIKIINPLDFPHWNEQAAELSGATIFHTSNWSRVLVDSYRYRPRYFCTFASGCMNRLIPVMEINSPITGKRGCVLPFSDQVEPLVAGDDFAEMFESIISYGRQEGWRTIDIHGGNGFFNTQKSYAAFISPYVVLDCSFRQLFKRFRSSTRRNVDKSEKLGVTATISNSKASMDAFQGLNSLTRRKHGLPPQPDRFFAKIHRHILAKEKGFVCLAGYRGKVIAGVVFFVANRQAIYKYGASDERYLHLRPNNLVMAAAIKHAIELGLQTINLGRTEKEHQGQLQFKMGWNAVPSTVRYHKFDIASGQWIVDRPLIRSSYSLFKRLPIPVLKVIGRCAYPHIG